MSINSTKDDFRTLDCNILAPEQCVIVITTVILFYYFPNKIRSLFLTNKKNDDEGYFSPGNCLGQLKKDEEPQPPLALLKQQGITVVGLGGTLTDVNKP